MKKAPPGDSLEHVQAIIARKTGAPLRDDAEQQLASVLREAAGSVTAAAVGENLLSREGTILLADLRGFTSISEAYAVTVVLEILNRYLASPMEVRVKGKSSR